MTTWRTYSGHVGDSDITPLIPVLISLLTPPNPEGEMDPEVFAPASDALQEIMTRSSLAGGAGVLSLTLPLLVWVDTWGPRILQSSTSCASLVLLPYSTLLIVHYSQRSVRALSFAVQTHRHPRRPLEHVLCYPHHLTTVGGRVAAHAFAARAEFSAAVARVHGVTGLLWCRRRGERDDVGVLVSPSGIALERRV